MNDVMIRGVVSGTISTLVGFPFDTIKIGNNRIILQEGIFVRIFVEFHIL